MVGGGGIETTLLLLLLLSDVPVVEAGHVILYLGILCFFLEDLSEIFIIRFPLYRLCV